MSVCLSVCVFLTRLWRNKVGVCLRSPAVRRSRQAQVARERLNVPHEALHARWRKPGTERRVEARDDALEESGARCSPKSMQLVHDERIEECVYVCVCLGVCLCMCVWLHIVACMFGYVCMYACVCMRVYVCMCVYVWFCVAGVYVCVCVYNCV